jgi:hypothetical protein
MIKKISIMDFPKNILIELPDVYRNIMFQLIFLECKTSMNIKRILREKNLKENVFRWRRGHDRGLPQFVNLESLLVLFDHAQRARNSIKRNLNIVKIQLLNSNKRIEKTKELMSLIKDVRFILRGNANMAYRFDINHGTLYSYVGRKEIKKLPLRFVTDLIKFIENNILCFSFTLDELQSKVVSYHAHHGKSIKPQFHRERKLPIKVTPEFESIIYHLFGDGHVKEIGSGEYTQLSEIGRKNFLNKLYNVFGYFEITKKSFDDGKVIIPKAIIRIVCKYYNLNHNSFNWNTSKLPLNISDDVEFKIASLVAFIVDEGYISDKGIEIYSSNKVLLTQIRNLAIDLSLDCSELKTKKPNGSIKESFRFRIRKESSINFIRMVKDLKEKYPYCGLAQKENRINNI